MNKGKCVLPEPPTIDWNDHALFIDVDGTLLEIEERPEIVRADDALIDMLSKVSLALDGALALVSGRPLADIDRVFSNARFVIVGSHGTEIRWADGDASNESTESLPPVIVDKAQSFADGNDGLLLERKAHGIALHYRQAPQLESRCRNFMRELLEEAGPIYRLLEGKKVFELTPLGFNKGTGVSRVLQVRPFRGRIPVYVGDDITDEDAFRVVNDAPGISIRVGQSAATAARFALESVSAVRGWLRDIADPGTGG